MKNIYIKLKLLAAKHRSFAMGTFVLIVFVAMIAVFSVLDNRYALSMITNASSIGNNSHQIAYGEDDANTVTVTATIQEDSNKPTAEIENGVKAEFEYQHDGQTVTVEGTVSVEKKDSGDNGGNGDNTNPTTGDNGGNGDSNVPGSGTESCEYVVTVVFSVPKDVKSGSYTINYDGKDISDDVTFENDAGSTEESQVPAIGKIDVNKATLINGIYYLNNKSSAIVNVEVDNSASGYSLTFTSDSYNKQTVALEEDGSSYSASFSISSKLKNKKISINVALEKDGEVMGKPTVITFFSANKPAIANVEVLDADYSDGIYRFVNSEQAAIKVTVFRPNNSNTLYMKTKIQGEDKVTTAKQNLKNETTEYTFSYEFGKSNSNKNVEVSFGLSKNFTPVDKYILNNSLTYFESVSAKNASESDGVFYLAKSNQNPLSEPVELEIKVVNPVDGYVISVNDGETVTLSKEETEYSVIYNVSEFNKSVQLTIDLSDGSNTIDSVSRSVFIDSEAPTITINKVSTVQSESHSSPEGELYYTFSGGSEIKGRWTNHPAVSVEFTVADAGIGLNDDFILYKSNVSLDDSTAKSLKRNGNKYTAYFILSIVSDNLTLKVNSLIDVTGNETIGTAQTGIGFDNVKPVIKDVQVARMDKDEYVYRPLEDWTDISNVFIASDSYRVKFYIDESDSGVDLNNIKVLVNNSYKTVHSEQDENGVPFYYCDVNVRVKNDVTISIYATDNAGNKSDIVECIMHFNNAPIVKSVTAVSDNEKDDKVAKIGDTITYTINTQDADDDEIQVISVILSNGEALVTKDNPVSVTNSQVSLQKKIEDLTSAEDMTTLTIKSIVLSDGKRNLPKISHSNDWSDGIELYAPIKLSAYNKASISVTSSTKKNYVRVDDTLTFTFDPESVTPKSSRNKHKVTVQGINLDYSIDSAEPESTEKIWKNLSLNDYSAVVTIAEDSDYKDLSEVMFRASYQLVDKAGNIATGAEQTVTTDDGESTTIPEEETISGGSGITYYAPIKNSSVQIECTSNDNKIYLKEGDTLTFVLSILPDGNLSNDHTLNYKVKVDKLHETEISATGNETVATIGNYDKDIESVSYTLTVYDDAEQEIVFDNVSTDFTYYAQIELVGEVGFHSFEPFTEYARDGSKLILQAKASHPVTVDSASVFSESHSIQAAGTTEPSRQLQIVFNSINGFNDEEILSPVIKLRDAAGNEKEFSLSDSCKITYDKTSPSVVIKPKLNGFLNDSFSCTAVFSDKNLYAGGMRFSYKASTTGEEKSLLDNVQLGENDTSYSQKLSLSEEDTYRITASVTDKAGNGSGENGMTVTIDKTSPKIVSVKLSTDEILVYKKGFIISQYIQIEEEYINELICKLSDNTGTYDWDIKQPIETEGKKTISIIATDMAGNSGSFTFEIFIDDTPPTPVVKDEASGREMTADQENIFTKKLNLAVLLDNPQITNNLSDEFTVLKLLDSEGKVVYDFMEKDGTKQEYHYSFRKLGSYSLVVEAKDHAIDQNGDDGNVFGPVTYKITFAEEGLLDRLLNNPLVFYSMLSLLGILLFGGAFILFLLFKRRKKN